MSRFHEIFSCLQALCYYHFDRAQNIIRRKPEYEFCFVQEVFVLSHGDLHPELYLVEKILCVSQLGNRLITACNADLMTDEKTQCVQNQKPSLETSHSMHRVIWHHDFFSYFPSLLKRTGLTDVNIQLFLMTSDMATPVLYYYSMCTNCVLMENHLWWLNSWMDSILSCSDLFYIHKQLETFNTFYLSLIYLQREATQELPI